MTGTRQSSWDQAYATAIELAQRSLQDADPEALCGRSGCRWRAKEGAVELDFLGERYRLAPPDFAATAAASGEPAVARERILMLHYLVTASGSPVTGEWIAFNEVPSGELYLGNFRARSVDRLVRSFAGREGDLASAAHPLAGVAADLGDASVLLPALPRVPMAVVLWRGDDEFPASGSVLFDASIDEYLPTEDMVVLAEMMATKLCSQGKGV